MSTASETYILPTTDWAVLLSPIVRDAKAGARLVVCTAAMYALCVSTVTEAGREDMTVELRREP